jgi:hypothetical protein
MDAMKGDAAMDDRFDRRELLLHLGDMLEALSCLGKTGRPDALVAQLAAEDASPVEASVEGAPSVEWDALDEKKGVALATASGRFEAHVSGRAVRSEQARAVSDFVERQLDIRNERKIGGGLCSPGKT